MRVVYWTPWLCVPGSAMRQYGHLRYMYGSLYGSTCVRLSMLSDVCVYGGFHIGHLGSVYGTPWLCAWKRYLPIWANMDTLALCMGSIWALYASLADMEGRAICTPVCEGAAYRFRQGAVRGIPKFGIIRTYPEVTHPGITRARGCLT
jgi:hypothetical protein